MINQLISQRYETLEKIGESPLFTVYKARDKVTNRIVALKTVAARYVDDSAFLEGLKDGLRASTRLNHPNITTCNELEEDEGTPYAIFEFVRGINLKERIRRIAPFTLSVAVDVACALGEALHYAHSLGQIHGDLRPQNIIISPEGAVKVTDFGVMAGIARSPEAQSEILLRAASYHAPELSTTQPGTASGDIYALGAVLFEMLTGVPVYAADTPEAIADLHAFSPIPSPKTINPGVPRSIEGIVVKCLQKRPEQRYHSAAELLNDLKSVRDALRFGKPLSWSPIDIDKLPVEPVAPMPAGPAVPVQTTAAVRAREPVATAASSRPLAMPTSNRLRAHDERVSTVIKALIGFMTGMILICIIGFFAIFRLDWGVPPPVTVPQMVGKPLNEVQSLAQKLQLNLILHGEYTDSPRNIVFKTDMDRGTQIRAGHYINVWYSKGPQYVDVPNLVGMNKEDAEQKLRDVGLSVGRVMPQFSNTVQPDVIISQNVSHKKRVLHDTAVDLVFSDGRQPDYTQDTTADNSNTNGSPDANADNNPSGTGGDTTGDFNSNPNPNPDDTATGTNPPEQPTSEFDRSINITGTPENGQGQCYVRIEYEDATGLHTVIDELHSEGDKVRVNFPYVGKMITLRIYYDDKKVFERTFDPKDPKNKGKIQGGAH